MGIVCIKDSPSTSHAMLELEVARTQEFVDTTLASPPLPSNDIHFVDVDQDSEPEPNDAKFDDDNHDTRAYR